jgi:hypothetical protein
VLWYRIVLPHTNAFEHTASICIATGIIDGMWWGYVGRLYKIILTVLTSAVKMEADAYWYPQMRLHGVTAHMTATWMLTILKFVCWHQSAMMGCGAQHVNSTVSVKTAPLVTMWLGSASVLRVGEEPGKSDVPTIWIGVWQTHLYDG